MKQTVDDIEAIARDAAVEIVKLILRCHRLDLSFARVQELAGQMVELREAIVGKNAIATQEKLLETVKSLHARAGNKIL